MLGIISTREEIVKKTICVTSKNVPLACFTLLFVLSSVSLGQTTRPTDEPTTQPVLTLAQQISTLDSLIDSRVNPPTPEDRGKLAMQRFQLRQQLSQEEAITNAPRLAAAKRTQPAKQLLALRPDAPAAAKKYFAALEKALGGKKIWTADVQGALATAKMTAWEVAKRTDQYAPRSRFGYEAGGVGVVGLKVLRDNPEGDTFKVLQVIDEQNFIATVSYSWWRKPTMENPSSLDELSLDEPVWVSGFSTAGFIDGKKNVLGGEMIQVVGTKQYSSNLGVKTVLLIQPFDIKPYLVQAGP